MLSAFRCVFRKVHPDRGGFLAELQRLNAARDSWDEARRSAPGPGRPTPQQRGGARSSEQVLLPTVSAAKGGYRIQSAAAKRRAKSDASSGAKGEAASGERRGRRATDLNLSSWHGRLPTKAGVVNLRQLIFEKAPFEGRSEERRAKRAAERRAKQRAKSEAGRKTRSEAGMNRQSEAGGRGGRATD